MALVNAVVQGVDLLSDVGIGASLIQNKRGEDAEFQRTAWTLQVLRSLLIFAVAAAAAWPAAELYDEPMLRSLIPVAAIGSLIAGFQSPALFLWRRRLELHKLISLEAAASTLNVVVTVALAWHWKSVWALAVGGLAGMTLKLVVGPSGRGPLRPCASTGTPRPAAPSTASGAGSSWPRRSATSATRATV